MHDLVESRHAIRQALPSRLVTQNHAAQLAGLSRRQMASLITLGRVATVECLGKRWVVRSSLLALIRELDRHGQA